MAAISGKAGLLKISTTVGGAGTYTTCLGISSFDVSIDGEMLDVTELPATYHARIQGLKDLGISASGTYQSGDTTGQLAIRNSLVNDTGELWVQAWPDGTTGVKSQVKVSSFKVDNSVAGSANVSFNLQGTGSATVT